MAEMTTPDNFASPTKEALAKRWKSSDPGHWVFPPWPGPGPSREGVFSDTQHGEKDPFSLDFSSSLALLAFTLSYYSK
jgi:hypothetical protein